MQLAIILTWRDFINKEPEISILQYSKYWWTGDGDGESDFKWYSEQAASFADNC